MAAVGHVLEAAPAVRDLLVLGQRVGDEREEADVGLEDLGQGFSRRPTVRCIGVHEQVQRRLERQRLGLALHLELESRHGLVEQAVPGAARGDRLLVEHTLELLLELIGLLLAQIVEPRLVAGERRHLQGARQRRIVDLVELQLEEDEARGDGGDLLLDVAVELGVLGIGGVGGVEQAGVGAELAQRVAERLVGGDRCRHGRAVGGEIDQLALVALLDALGFGSGLLQVRRDGSRGGPGIEVGEVPHRHRPQIAGGATLQRFRPQSLATLGIHLSRTPTNVVLPPMPSAPGAET